MKKYFLFCLLFITSFIFLLIFNSQIKEELNYVNRIFLLSYIPSILPFILIVNIFLKKVNFVKIYNFFSKKKITTIFDILIIFICLAGGTPSCGFIINHLVNNSIYSKEKGNAILSNFSIISLPFIYSITSRNILYISLLILLSIISYLLTNFSNNTCYNKHNELKLDVFAKSINSLSNLYIFISISVIISFPIKLLNNNYFYFILGIFETSFASINLIEQYPLLTYFIMSFTSFSLIYQLKNTYSYLNILYHLKKRLFIASLLTLLMFIFS